MTFLFTFCVQYNMDDINLWGTVLLTLFCFHDSLAAEHMHDCDDERTGPFYDAVLIKSHLKVNLLIMETTAMMSSGLF